LGIIASQNLNTYANMKWAFVNGVPNLGGLAVLKSKRLTRPLELVEVANLSKDI